ncbi:MAG: hypothetical protein KAU26_05295, partial [Methylococcales bacterium]|nr:hypothetical protein [Methylococcales bacterium]
MPTYVRIFYLIFFVLSACGYQLRGTIALPKGMENIYLEGASGQLQSEIQTALKFSKGQLVNTAKTAGIVIKVQKEAMRTRVLSVSSTGKANQFELIYELRFSIYEPSGTLLLANQRVQSQRSYFNDQGEVLA